jgi:hypothetical protein
MGERQPEHDDAILATFLADRDVPCPRCAYNLRALAGSCCPECGLSLRLSVNAAEPSLQLWSAALVEASIGSGAGALFFALILGKAGPPPASWHWILAIAWSCIPVTALVGLQRRRITSWSTAAQWALVVALAVVLLVLLIGVGLTVG